MSTTHTPQTPVPDVPPINYNAIRQALKAHGVTLVEFECEMACRCEICGAEWSIVADLDCGISRYWWECTQYHDEEDDDAHT